MSLNIEIDDVRHVLLADGWHEVVAGTFDLDAYEFIHGSQHILGGGQSPPVPNTGFQFQSGEDVIMGPLTALFAVKRSLRP